MPFLGDVVDTLKTRRELQRNTKSNRSNLDVTSQIREARKQELRENVLDASAEDTYIAYAEIQNNLKSLETVDTLHDILAVSGVLTFASENQAFNFPKSGAVMRNTKKGKKDKNGKKKKRVTRFEQKVEVYEFCEEEEDEQSDYRKGVDPSRLRYEELGSSLNQHSPMQRVASPTKGFWIGHEILDEGELIDPEEEESISSSKKKSGSDKNAPRRFEIARGTEIM